MRINQNISAMNTYSRLTSANTAKSSSLAKLSSGLRINRAGDDAAGLAISEKMRGQVGGLKQAIRNAQDGISLIQTAEGALTETHSILNRMRELAVQAATDTNTPEDRLEIQKEMNELATEVTRISTDTQFNTMELLDGKRTEGFTFHIGANESQNHKIDIADMGAGALGVEGELQEETGYDVSKLFGLDEETLGQETVLKVGQNVVAVKVGDEYYALSDVKAVKEDDSYKLEKKGEPKAIEYDEDSGGTFGGIDVSTQSAADEAITIIDKAINLVSAERSKLGATQNRLEHTINNLTATAENLSAAESRIRDVDMAEEMMEFTKNNILSQAATAMLAQANQMPQSVLQLLQ